MTIPPTPSSDIAKRYRDGMTARLDAITDTQQAAINEAAQMFYEQIKADRLIHVYGVGGHSYVGSEEFFFRAGGLANISPMFEPSLSLAGGGQKSTLLERVEDIGDKIVKAHHLGSDDLLVITSAYGINACTIDAALEAKRRGCRVIAISSVAFAEATPRDFKARHHNQKNLGEIADVIIDNHVPHGETLLQLGDYPQKVGGTCNVLQCFCVNWLVMEAIDLCLKNGVEPPVWKSANTLGGDEHNESYLKKYTSRVKAL
ncbi:MAG: sugar isomerase domain-containing protein [Synoicihabitans sp.]